MEFECMWRVPVVSILHTEVSSFCLRRTWNIRKGQGKGWQACTMAGIAARHGPPTAPHPSPSCPPGRHEAGQGPATAAGALASCSNPQ